MTDKKPSDEKSPASNTSTEAADLKATPGKDAPAHIAAAADSVSANDIVAAHQGLAAIDPDLNDASEIGLQMRLDRIEAWMDAYARRLATLLDDHFQGKV